MKFRSLKLMDVRHYGNCFKGLLDCSRTISLLEQEIQTFKEDLMNGKHTDKLMMIWIYLQEDLINLAYVLRLNMRTKNGDFLELTVKTEKNGQ